MMDAKVILGEVCKYSLVLLALAACSKILTFITFKNHDNFMALVRSRKIKTLKNHKGWKKGAAVTCCFYIATVSLTYELRT